MDLQKAKAVATKLIEKHLSSEWKIVFSNRVSRCYGNCQTYRSGKPGRIAFFRDATSQSSEEEFMDTVLHEIAHGLAPFKAGHGYQWKKIFMEIGGSGRRNSTYTFKLSKGYEAKCSICNHTFTRIKAPSRGRTYSHCCHPITWIKIGEQVSIAAKTEPTKKKSCYNHLNSFATGFIDSKLDVSKSLIIQGYDICKDWNINNLKQIGVNYIINHCKHLEKEHGVNIIW